MLSKLLKYELKATARWFLPMYAGVFALALINRLLLFFQPYLNHNMLLSRFYELINGLTILGYILVIFATFALTFFIMLQRFYKNLLGDEGYLMFTLPVSSSQLVISKLITSCLWTIATIVVTLSSVFILLVNEDLFTILNWLFKEITRVIMTYEGMQATLICIELIVLMLFSLIQGILMMYTALALGGTRSGHKILYSFGFYMLINFALQVITSIVIFVGGMILDNDFIAAISSNIPPYVIIHFLMLSSIIIAIIFSVVEFIVTNYVLSKKLNLE